MKKTIKLIFSLIVFVSLSAFTFEKGINDSFKDQLKDMNASFKMPANYEETDVIDNEQLPYEFAIKEKSNEFEIRYIISPINQQDIEDHLECQKIRNCKSTNPNEFWKSLLPSLVMNMSGGQSLNYKGFEAGMMKQEYNADGGGTGFCELQGEFGEDYKYGQVVVIHKDNVADLIFICLSNDKEVHRKLLGEAFYTIKFN